MIQIKGYYPPYSQCFDFVRDGAWYEKAEMSAYWIQHSQACGL